MDPMNLSEVEPRLSRKKFTMMMALVVGISLLFVFPESAIGVVRGNMLLIILGGLTFSLTIIGGISLGLVKSGRFNIGVYFWCLTSSFVMALIPLVTSGLGGIAVECAIFNLLIIALFVSPRHLKRFVLFYTVPVAIAVVLEAYVPWPRLTMTGPLMLITLGVDLAGVIIIGLLIILQGDVLLKALDSTKAYAGFLEKATEAELKYIATHDALTSLPNRVLLGDRFHQMRAHARRFRQNIALLLIDLDHFKEVNDSLGHGAGDQLLKDVSRRLERSVRECDTVVRMGGDEFIILLGDLADPVNSGIVARRILDVLEPPFVLGSQEVRVSASIGISAYPENGDKLEELLKNADMALYAAKGQGRRTFVPFTTTMSAEASERKTLGAALTEAVANHEFVLHYQPIVDVISGRITGLEALLRWDHPTMGLLPPLRFLSIAEETGLIIPIGQWVLTTACRQILTWRGQGLSVPAVAINLSPRQLYHRDIVTMFKKVLAETGVEPGCLELEITESSAMQNEEEASNVLSRLRGMGMRIVIDDFGSGYSSMQRLRSLPIDALKIDRFFIQNIVDDPGNAAIVMAIITLARNLKLRVIAEGVETKAQLDFLRSLKLQFTGELQCDLAQGFLFSMPQSPDKIGKMLQNAISASGSLLPGENRMETDRDLKLA